MKLIEKYAFITNENHSLHSESSWPRAISVGNDFKMVQFTNEDETNLIKFIESLGFTAKYLSGDEIIKQMNAKSLGPFVCDIADAIHVVSFFNPQDLS